MIEISWSAFAMDPPKPSLFFGPDKESNDSGLMPDKVQIPASLHPWLRVVFRLIETRANVNRNVKFVFNLVYLLVKIRQLY